VNRVDPNHPKTIVASWGGPLFLAFHQIQKPSYPTGFYKLPRLFGASDELGLPFAIECIARTPYWEWL
jgi:hypothetical protein